MTDMLPTFSDLPAFQTLSDGSIVAVTATGPVLIPSRVVAGFGAPGLVPGGQMSCSREQFLEEVLRLLNADGGTGRVSGASLRPLGTTGLLSLDRVAAAGATHALSSFPDIRGSKGMAARQVGLLRLDVSQLDAAQRLALREDPTHIVTAITCAGENSMDRSPDGQDTRRQWAEAHRVMPAIASQWETARVVVGAHLGPQTPRVPSDSLYLRPSGRLTPAERQERAASKPDTLAFWNTHVLLTESLSIDSIRPSGAQEGVTRPSASEERTAAKVVQDVRGR